MICWGPLLVPSGNGDAWSLLTWSLLKCLVAFPCTRQRKDWCICSSTVFRWSELEHAGQKFGSCSYAITTLSIRATHWCSDNLIITFWSWGKCIKTYSNVTCHSFLHWQNSDLELVSITGWESSAFLLPQTYSKSYSVQIPTAVLFCLKTKRRSMREASNAFVLSLWLSTRLTIWGRLQSYCSCVPGAMSKKLCVRHLMATTSTHWPVEYLCILSNFYQQYKSSPSLMELQSYH